MSEYRLAFNPLSGRHEHRHPQGDDVVAPRWVVPLMSWEDALLGMRYRDEAAPDRSRSGSRTGLAYIALCRNFSPQSAGIDTYCNRLYDRSSDRVVIIHQERSGSFARTFLQFPASPGRPALYAIADTYRHRVCSRSSLHP